MGRAASGVQSAVAANWGKAADKIFVGDDHAETQSTALTVASRERRDAELRLLCRSHGGRPAGYRRSPGYGHATVSGATAAFILSGSAMCTGSPSRAPGPGLVEI